MSAVQLQAHQSAASPENSDTMSRSDVALHEANHKNSSIPSHSPVLAKDDEDTQNHATNNGAAAAAVNNDDGTSDAQNKSCWSFLTCCFAKPVNKPKDPAYEDRKNNIDHKQPAQSSVPMAVKQSEDSKSSATAAAPAVSNAAASLMTQVSQDAPQPVAPPVQFTAIRPPPAKCLLGPLTDAEKGKKTLVLDLDETLVHSSFKPIPNADFVISIELENVIHRVFVLKRPGVDAFLRAVGAKFEVVVFTASLAKYADPLLDILDRSKVVKTRLFREACVHHYGNYVKDLSHLGRRLEDTIIIDNSPFSYMFQPDNAIPITSWFNDKNDRQLYDLLPFLDSLTTVDDVCTLLHRRKQAQLAAGTNMA